MGRYILSLLLFVSCSSNAAFEETPRGARSVALGGTMVSVSGDLWAAFANPSCLRVESGINAAVEYVPGIFGIWEVRRGAISILGATPWGTVALSTSAFGFDLYHEFSAGLAASRALSDRIAIGIGLNLYSLTIRGYGSDRSVGIDIGTLIAVANGVSYGIALRNVNRPTIGNHKEPLPQSMGMGISITPLPDALVAIGAVKDSRYPFELSIGLEYSLENLLTFRLGATHEPATIAAGIGIRSSLLSFDYAYSMHPDLGGTHCISVSFSGSWP